VKFIKLTPVILMMLRQWNDSAVAHTS